MTPRIVPSLASRARLWLLAPIAALACSPELHIVASMDPDAAAAGMGGAGPEEPEATGQTGNRDCTGGCCDDTLRDGDETDVDCGGSCAPCGDGYRCTAATDCKSKVCKNERCAAATCDDGVLNGGETARDCGGSTCDGCPFGAFCKVATDCRSGLCDFALQKCGLNCEAGTAECDADFSVECETNLLTSVDNCGNCGNLCSARHASAVCHGGSCAIERCEDGFDDCDGNPANGCETSLATLDDCGACGVVCPDVIGAVSFCVDGECGYSACDFDYGDCNGKLSDGCETVLMDDPDNCGRCGRRCENAHGNTACKTGDCVVTCAPDWADCDGNADNGCESDLASPVTCGSCDHACAEGEVCGDGICYGLPCDGLCENATRALVATDEGYTRDPIGTGELCVELFGYNVSPVKPALACWNMEAPRTLEVSGVPMTCDGEIHEFTPSFREGGLCLHVSAGGGDAAGFELLGEERPR